MQENIYLHIYIPRVSSDTIIPYTIFTKIDTIKSEQRHSFIYMGMHIFTFTHLTDAFIQSDKTLDKNLNKGILLFIWECIYLHLRI